MKINSLCYLVLLSLIMLVCSCKQQQNTEALISEAVELKLKQYPQSTLQDLYKSFFQDRFGPGHLIHDTASAGSYLRRELQSCENLGGAMYEPTGYLGNFYRVNLSVIKNGLIDYNTYFDAFLRSVQSIKSITIEEWLVEWNKINSVIGKLSPEIANYKTDCERIDSLIKSGNYVMHHSKTFRNAYNPHYRLISKEIFEAEFLPIISRAN